MCPWPWQGCSASLGQRWQRRAGGARLAIVEVGAAAGSGSRWSRRPGPVGSPAPAPQRLHPPAPLPPVPPLPAPPRRVWVFLCIGELRSLWKGLPGRGAGAGVPEAWGSGLGVRRSALGQAAFRQVVGGALQLGVGGALGISPPGRRKLPFCSHEGVCSIPTSGRPREKSPPTPVSRCSGASYSPPTITPGLKGRWCHTYPVARQAGHAEHRPVPEGPQGSVRSCGVVFGVFLHGDL